MERRQFLRRVGLALLASACQAPPSSSRAQSTSARERANDLFTSRVRNARSRVRGRPLSPPREVPAELRGIDFDLYRQIRYRPDRIVKTPSRRSRAVAVKDEVLDVVGNELLAVLKAKRLRLAEARGVPAYVIFSDKSLADMAVKRPVTRDEFAGVFGVGEAKLRDFADIFLETIANN